MLIGLAVMIIGYIGVFLETLSRRQSPGSGEFLGRCLGGANSPAIRPGHRAERFKKLGRV